MTKNSKMLVKLLEWLWEQWTLFVEHFLPCNHCVCVRTVCGGCFFLEVRTCTFFFHPRWQYEAIKLSRP